MELDAGAWTRKRFTWTRAIALASASFLSLFGIAMAVSFGIKSPLDHSVFSACAAALLLALCRDPD